MSSESDSGSYWARALEPRYPRRHPAQQAINDRVFNRPQTLETVVPETVQETVVPKHASEWVNAESPHPHMLTAEQMVELRLGYGALPSMVTPVGLRDPDYQAAQHLAAQHTNLGASPTTSHTIIKETS